MIGRAARIWAVIAVGGLLDAAEPSAPGPVESPSSRSFVDLTRPVDAADSGDTRDADSRAPLKRSFGTADGPKWLLEAMARESEAPPASIDDLLREVREGRHGAPARDEPVPKTSARAPNPFAKYLASWMTAEDYALLQVGTEGQPTNLTGERNAGEGVSKARLRARVATDGNPFLSAGHSAQENERSRETAVAAPPQPGPQVPQGPAAVPSLPTTVNEPPAMPATPARAPWQPPAQDDKKYFPQLNRF